MLPMTRALKRFLIKESIRKINSEGNPFYSEVLLGKEESHHLKNVLRVNQSEKCLILDPKGNEFIGEVQSFRDDGQCEIRVLEKTSGSSPLAFKLTVAQAIPQNRKMDIIVEKAAELGVNALIPLITERTIVRLPKEKTEKVVERWQRIANQTVKQSRQRIIPEICDITNFRALWTDEKRFGEVIVLHPEPASVLLCESLFSSLRSDKELKKKFLFVIGPEGGFSGREIEFAKSKRTKIASLGEGLLKTDTAFVVAVGLFKLWSFQTNDG